MTAWSPAKIDAFKKQFYHFLNHVKINSKDRGPMILGEHLFEAQIRFYDAVFKSLGGDVHDIKHLKSRQLGISTASRALTLFWIGMHNGLKGYMILDTDPHKEEARLELIDMVDNLPKSLGFPGRDKQTGGSSNRNLLKLSNQSTLMFASAGIRASKTGGVLGRGSGVNFVHASEVCSWENTEGLESFRNSLSQEFENRLYLWESTGRGYNDWYWMWNDSKADPHHQTAHFTGWWGKNNQRIKREDPDFLRYGVTPRSEEEHERIAEVEKLYGWRISDEQLAWWRRHIDPKSQDADNDKVYEASGLQLIEQPWTENDAFMAGNATFFDAKQLTDMASKNVSNKFKSYYYMAGSEFIHMRVTKAANLRSQMLKVWEEPDPDGVYVLGVDPAFGINEKNDCSVIQVFRCYADGCDQVAEYAWPLITTKQFAWVIAHLLGWYDNCYLVLELNGPGDSTWRELKDLKREIQRGIVSGTQMEDGFYNIFEHVKNFIYTRSDSMYAGKALQFKTTGPLKVTLMERFRDYVTNGMVTLKSTAAVEEMKSIQRDGDHIAAAGAGKDDRVLGAALAVYYWADKIKAQMSQMKRTRTNELAKRRLSVRDLSTMYTEYQIQGFFAAKRREKAKAHTAAARQKWRGR